jgi:hypothetical protein
LDEDLFEPSQTPHLLGTMNEGKVAGKVVVLSGVAMSYVDEDDVPSVTSMWYLMVVALLVVLAAGCGLER